MKKKRGKADKKVSGLKRHRVKGIPVIKHGVPQPGITKEEFIDVLTKAIPPIERKDNTDSENEK